MSTVQNQLAELDTELADIRVKSGQLTKDLAKLDAELADLERRASDGLNQSDGVERRCNDDLMNL